MRVLYVSTELYPLLKTGGLADVNAALPPALIRLGVDVRLLVPGFGAFTGALTNAERVAVIDTGIAPGATLLRGRLNDVPAYVIDAPALYARPGNPYVG